MEEILDNYRGQKIKKEQILYLYKKYSNKKKLSNAEKYLIHSFNILLILLNKNNGEIVL